MYMGVDFLKRNFDLCHSIVGGVLTYFGRNSLYLYLCQSTSLNVGIGTIRMFTIFLSALTIVSALTYIVKKVKVLDVILFGNF